MKSIVIGTAGHIDHGKTALVKALTGIDADRLEEEKRRGITIDLGFAHMHLPASNGETLRVGFVDVPGHERFVRNMLAGAGGIDLVLLVIAADESIKPQTREHFEILQLLGIKNGITVLTKSDAVDSETLDVVRMEVEDFVRGTFLETPGSPMVSVSSLTGAGVEELKIRIAEMAMATETRNAQALARMPIDRVFTMTGFGTVVTGTLVAGTISREDELETYPGRKRVRVRGVQVHGEASESAAAGQRTALNLAGATTEDLHRGMTLAPAGILQNSRRADVKLRLLASAKRPLKDRARVHFHAQTMEAVAEIVLAGEKQLEPGSESFARIRFPNEVFLLPGDRFIIRQFSPVITIGGGVVVDAPPLSRAIPDNAIMKILAGTDRAAVLKTRIARQARRGIALAQLVAETGWPKSQIESLLADLVKHRQIERTGEFVVDVNAWEQSKAAIIGRLEEFHKNNRLANGIGKEELRAHTAAGGAVFDGVVEALVREKRVEITNDLVRLSGRGITMKDEEAESKQTIEQAFATAGLKVPALHEVIAALQVDKARAQKLVTLLLRDKVLVKISDELVFHRSALDRLRGDVTTYKKKSSKIDVANFKELTGVSRKYAIPLLEYLDRERVTKRVGDLREIL